MEKTGEGIGKEKDERLEGRVYPDSEVGAEPALSPPLLCELCVGAGPDSDIGVVQYRFGFRFSDFGLFPITPHHSTTPSLHYSRSHQP